MSAVDPKRPLGLHVCLIDTGLSPIPTMPEIADIPEQVIIQFASFLPDTLVNYPAV